MDARDSLKKMLNYEEEDRRVVLPQSDELTKFYSRIKGLYRKELEEYLSRRVMGKDPYLHRCKVIFGYSQPEDKYIIIWSHDREVYHDPNHEDILMYVTDFIHENPLTVCAYCNETINKKTSNSFCGKDVCPKCEEFSREVIIKRNMERDLKQWEES